jgi:hypothetical protein
MLVLLFGQLSAGRINSREMIHHCGHSRRARDSQVTLLGNVEAMWCRGTQGVASFLLAQETSAFAQPPGWTGCWAASKTSLGAAVRGVPLYPQRIASS